ncbi:MAG: DNA polymerase III subunit alpha, partial [Desulfobacteraceae bacterium]
PARISMPDIDVDFCIEGREKVYKYVIDRYGGGDYVCQIITFGKLKSRAVIRDVGRALSIPLAEVDEIAKMIPDGVKNLTEAIKEVPAIQEKADSDPVKQEMLKIALVLEGLPRHASTHAAGVVISDKPLVDYLPLYKGKEGETLTQFDMNYVEKLGLVKFDFLGLRNLTVIKNTIALLKKQSKPVPDLLHLDMADKKTFELLAKADTTGVFQLESSGMKELIARLSPASFSDIVALVALYRPGPLNSGMADTYVERRHGREKVEYLFPELEPILKETYGVILYQEQVMKIAGALANYSMADADGLRKAMGKKIASMMTEHRDLFLKGARENNLCEKKAEALFDLMEKFGGYGFNKSHSAAYALICYQTAYLKAHFPLEYMAALMTSEMNNSDSVVKFMDECRIHDIDVLVPDVNESEAVFTVGDNAIRFGLAAVKNVGQGAIESIVEARNNDGPFVSLFDFCERVNLGKVNKRVLESLIKCGALDSVKCRRSQMMACLEDALDHGHRIQKEKNDSQMDLFADVEGGSPLPANLPKLPDIKEWPDSELLAMEKEILGFYITGHPLKKYETIIAKHTSATTLTLHDKAEKQSVRIGGTIKPLKVIKTKKGDMMAFVSLEDMQSSVEVVVFPETYADTHQLISDEAPVIIQGEVQKRENNVKLLAERIVPMEQAEQEWTASIVIYLDLSEKPDHENILPRLKTIVDKHPGTCSTYLHIKISQNASVVLQLSEENRVAPENSFFKEVKDLLGARSVETKCASVNRNNTRKKNRKYTNPHRQN